MIQIRIADAGDQIQGKYKCKSQQSLDHSVQGTGKVEANYLYHETIYAIGGSLQAMSVVPCDVDVRIEVHGDRVVAEGYVLLYVPHAYVLVNGILGTIMMRACKAAFMGPASHAKITFLQTWDRQN